MSKILALDYGASRIGVAVSDLRQTVAFPREPLLNNSVWEKDLDQIIQTEQITKIILGNPLNQQGKPSEQSQIVKTLRDKLERELGVTVELIDERYTTVQARRNFNLAKIPTRRQKGLIDSAAAQIMLQMYLDRNN
ncbi:Holliday junction resolvase RuvX [Candidatus Peregrinibacteria bacterium CG08_land_8_20_14_0_20_41_10]|nr:MAG: hypothetical protein AUJ78_00050 [Candidatus Peregrinibacteria bacterium CG1_02_41_10]PIS32382.1 MAG: Holliday junction resolvase RuvX [Candidatus Peregrinibacteria bacterium CG08_land_8_20_14_0_20_41_10]